MKDEGFERRSNPSFFEVRKEMWVMHVTLYTRPHCSLCEEAKLMLQLVQEDASLTWDEVNIEADDEIHEKYMLMIPVVERNGEVLLSGVISYGDLLLLVQEDII